MIKVNSTISMELGKRYLFRLANGSSHEVVIKGSHATASGDMLDIEVDGQVGQYPGLDGAIGSFISFSPV